MTVKGSDEDDDDERFSSSNTGSQNENFSCRKQKSATNLLRASRGPIGNSVASVDDNKTPSPVKSDKRISDVGSASDHASPEVLISNRSRIKCGDDGTKLMKVAQEHMSRASPDNLDNIQQWGCWKHGRKGHGVFWLQ